MRNRVLLALTLFLTAGIGLSAAGRSVSGVITDNATKEPLCGVVLKIDDGAMWAVTDAQGRYSFSGLSDGSYLLSTDFLGYVQQTVQLFVSKDGASAVDAKGNSVSLDFKLDAESLALNEVTVTAQRPAGTLGTSHNIGSEALEHLQMSNVTDMNALLPGGKTTNPDLTQDNAFSLRDGGTSTGNASFGTAVEVDGVRLETNAGMGDLAGASTRSVSVGNIGSIEVITGIPSAEYGDLNSGMVKINTKKGRTPVNIIFSVNPRTYQASVSKGFDLGADRGILNASGEWARATTKLISPYEAYTRRNVSLTYSNTFAKKLRFEIGGTVNIGGMNKKDDPDADNGNLSKVNDNAYRLNSSLSWMLNKSWITTLKLEGSVSMHDTQTKNHQYNSSATSAPAAHSEEKGYFIADMLPLKYYSDQVIDSKELNGSVSLKYDWTRTFGVVKNRLKAGVQFKSNGNIGKGEYYEDMSLAPNGYRPRPYSQYPFMHNLSEYIEDQVTVPVGVGKLDFTAGLRFEQVFVKDSKYSKVNTLSPRLNAKWAFSKNVTLRGGWGVSEKLPSFHILYPEQKYRDIQSFAVTSGSNSYYSFYTMPYKMVDNPDLRWQRNYNSEVGVDLKWGDWKISLVGFYNKTVDPYQAQTMYTPFTYKTFNEPTDKTNIKRSDIQVDRYTGEVTVKGEKMTVNKTVDTYVEDIKQINGKPIHRAGAELTVDFPEIKAIRTAFRVDASYSYSSYVDDVLSFYYNYPDVEGKKFPYVGIYANGKSSSVTNGKIAQSLDANITSITHIPQARLVITCKLEMTLLRRSQNLSSYNGADYAYRVKSSLDKTPAGGSIYDGDSFTAIRPVAYLDHNGVEHQYTAASASDPVLSTMILMSGNDKTFNPDGYNFYCCANLNITKEIGKHVSLSFFANNFTASRPAVKSLATGVSAVFTPAFYYGLTCRLKF